MKEVLLKRPNAGLGTTDLVRVTVLSEKDGKMRVKVPGVFHPQEIDASATLPVTRRAAQQIPAVMGSFARDLYR